MANTRKRRSRRSKRSSRRNPGEHRADPTPGTFAAMFAQAGGKSKKRKGTRRKSRK